MDRLTKGSIFIKWLISYLCIFIVVLLIGTGIYFYSYNIIQTQQQEISQKVLERVETNVNRYLLIAKNTAVSIMLDTNLEKISNKDTELSIPDRENIYRIYKNIQNRLFASKELEHIYIWLLNGDTVISDLGHMNKRSFHSLYMADSGITFENFEEMLRQYGESEFIMLPHANGENEILCLVGKHGRGNDKSGAVIAVSISAKELEKDLISLKWHEEQALLIVLNEYGISSDILDKDMLQKTEIIENTLQGDIVRVHHIDYNSEILHSKNGISYISLTPTSLVSGDAGKIRTFAMITLFICLPVVSLIAFFFTKKHYLPLQRLMYVFGEYKYINDAKDEFDWLTTKAKQIILKYEEIKHKNAKVEERLKYHFLFRILTLPYQKLQHEEYENIICKRPYNLVALIQIESDMNEDFDMGLYAFILHNIVEEVMGESYGIFSISLEESIALIINSNDRNIALRDQIEEAFERIQRYINENFDVRISIFFGSWHSHIEGIHTSYLRAREAMAYKDRSTDIIWYEDIKNRYRVYQYDTVPEQKIIYLIQIADFEKAFEIIKEIIDSNYHKMTLTPHMKKYLIADIFGTLIKAIQELDNAAYLLDDIEDYDMQNDIKEEKVLLKFKTLLDKVQSKYAEIEKKDTSQFSIRIMQYIKENFKNPDLNISITALHFKMTPSYLSAIFKEQTGIALLEYINNARVEYVKELLHADMSLNDISELAGFRNSGTLIRVFKKITGVTPGQMRNILKNENEVSIL